MAAKKRGLGKGLDALFVDNNTATPAAEGVQMVAISEIEPNGSQPRRTFDPDALAELTASIEEHGVLQPILLRPTAGGYQIVAGERRWRAARQAGLREMPAVVREMTEEAVAKAALVENLQREDLNPVEEAQGYQQLMENYSLTQEQVASTVSKSRPAIANALRLLNLPEEVLALLGAGSLSAGHAKALLSLKNRDNMAPAAEEIVKKGLSVRQAESYCKRLNAAENKVQVLPALPPIYREVELSLSEILGRRVKVAPSGDGGKLEIEFFSTDDLTMLARSFDENI